MTERQRQRPAICRGARGLLAITVSISLVTILVVAAAMLLRVHPRAVSGAWMEALTLSAPALRSAGDPIRHPETMHPSIDLRYCVGLESAV